MESTTTPVHNTSVLHLNWSYQQLPSLEKKEKEKEKYVVVYLV